MKENKIIIEGKEFELPDELVNKIKEELNKPKKLDYSFIYTEVINKCVKPEVYDVLCPSDKHRQKLEAINKLMNTAKYLNGEWKSNWEDLNEYKHSIIIINENITLDYNINRTNNIIYFKTKELALQALEILGEKTIKLALSTDW